MKPAEDSVTDKMKEQAKKRGYLPIFLRGLIAAIVLGSLIGAFFGSITITYRFFDRFLGC